MSEDEQLRVHERSIDILEKVGIKFLSDKALKILETNGAKVDYGEKLARISREMVDQALKTSPKSFVLGARNPEFDVAHPSEHTGYVLDCGGVFTYDYKSGERRYSTLKDCEQAFRVFEEMSLGSYVWPHSAPDLEKTHPNSSQVMLDLSSLMWTSKHVQDELTDPREVPYMIEGMKAILGSEEAVKERKIYSVCYCTLAPMTHDGGMSEALIDLSEFEIPDFGISDAVRRLHRACEPVLEYRHGQCRGPFGSCAFSDGPSRDAIDLWRRVREYRVFDRRVSGRFSRNGADDRSSCRDGFILWFAQHPGRMPDRRKSTGTASHFGKDDHHSAAGPRWSRFYTGTGSA